MVEMPDTEHYIDGEWRAADTEKLPVVNPTTEEELTTVPVATEDRKSVV